MLHVSKTNSHTIINWGKVADIEGCTQNSYTFFVRALSAIKLQVWASMFLLTTPVETIASKCVQDPCVLCSVSHIFIFMFRLQYTGT